MIHVQLYIYKRKWLYWFYKGKQSESMYLIGEQRQTCQILANKYTSQFWPIQIEGAPRSEEPGKGSKCEKLRETVKVDHVDTSAELIPKPEQTAITTDYMMR